MKFIRFLPAVIMVCLMFPSKPLFGAAPRRVLIVTTGRPSPVIFPFNNGETVITDLTAAGYPFDVVSYDRYIRMPIDDSDVHDIVILNGHTAPVPVGDVAAGCLRWLQAGRKIFINGHLPYTRYDDGGNAVETIEYGAELFDFTPEAHWVSGKAVVPEDLEKDREITSIGHLLCKVRACRLKSQPDRIVTLNGHIIAFLAANGGAVCGTSDYILNLLDYGKVVHHLRYGGTGMVGFANDRIEGKPLVSFEVHCDATRDLAAIDAVESLAGEFRIPLVNLLVRDRITEDAAKRWNEASRSPFMAIGSHSRTHPKDWPSVSDFDGQTSGALDSQRTVIPATGTYFNFSGAMNPTPRQIDELYRSGTVFGAKGQDSRWAGHPFGVPWYRFRDNPLKSLARHFLLLLWSPREIQVMPTDLEWLIALSQAEATPYCLSQTLPSDFEVWESKKKYDEEIGRYFDKNVQYGLYTYGYIHDYANNTAYGKYRTQGIHLAHQIRSALAYLRSKDVKFIGPEDLIRRLRDFVTGWIDYDTLPDGCLNVTVHRENALANEVKVRSRNNMAPVASGESVTAQHLAGNTLYITLKAEVKSSFNVCFTSN